MTTSLHDSVTPFTIHVPDEVLDDLRDRLERSRWADDPGNDDESYGVSTGHLRELVDHWRGGFDWRHAEREMNAHRHHRVVIDGVPIHFLREPGRGPAPVPLLLLHGWPGSFWFWSKVIGPLTDPASFGGDPADSFDVVVPSLPGFGFSTPVSRPDMNFWKMADLFDELMTGRLGYARYAAGGEDYGALVTAQLGHRYASHLVGIHLAHDAPLTMFQGERAWDVTGGRMVPGDAPPPVRDAILRRQSAYASHVAVHVLDAQTITHGLNDSPIGLLAWLLQRWQKWSDPDVALSAAFPRDFLLAQATLYWATRSIGSSIRVYPNTARYPWRPSHDRSPVVEAPAGFTFLTGNGVTPEDHVATFRATRGSTYNTTYARAFARGGHFAALENPEAVIEGIRETFRPLRASR